MLTRTFISFKRSAAAFSRMCCCSRGGGGLPKLDFRKAPMTRTYTMRGFLFCMLDHSDFAGMGQAQASEVAGGQRTHWTPLTVVFRAPKDHINIKILPTMVSGIPLYWALEPECKILVFMRSFWPLVLAIPRNFSACWGS